MKNGIILFLAFGLLIVIANASYGENVNSTSYEEIEAAVADFFTALAEQSPEFPAVLKRVGTSTQDLAALMLTLDDFVGELVQGLLHGVRLKT